MVPSSHVQSYLATLARHGSRCHGRRRRRADLRLRTNTTPMPTYPVSRQAHGPRSLRGTLSRCLSRLSRRPNLP
jgi:hypothetical protein